MKKIRSKWSTSPLKQSLNTLCKLRVGILRLRGNMMGAQKASIVELPYMNKRESRDKDGGGVRKKNIKKKTRKTERTVHEKKLK